MAGRLYCVIFAALVAADQLTKLLLPTPEWGWDDKAVPAAAAAVGFAAVAVFLAYPPTRIVGVFFASALASNFASALNGDVANPFVVNDIAWNLADFTLLVGYVLIPCSVPFVYRDVKRRLAA